MLTYFVFMLQKHPDGRKDRTETPFLPAEIDRSGSDPFIPGVAPRRKVLKWARKMRHHGGKRAEICADVAKEKTNGCSIL
jgi:hypothetical protein